MDPPEAASATQQHPQLQPHQQPHQQHDPHAAGDQRDLAPRQPCEPTTSPATAGPAAEASLPPRPPQAEAEPVASIAQRLSLLQNQQQDTLRQLMHLRMEQLRLRQQQLKALQCMLQAELAELQNRPLQDLAANQAMRLLSVSLHDLQVLYNTMQADSGLAATHAAMALSAADTRAEEVSRIVRELLQVLREGRHHAAGGQPDELAGATEEELRALPMQVCAQDSVLCGESCMICLSPFLANDTLRCLQCAHHCHAGCLDEWLRIKASCPLCKLNMRAGFVEAS